MNANYPYCHLARIVLQTTSPLSISTGFGDGLQDALVVLDANALPALPGTSIAGVLRHLYFDVSRDKNKTNTLFGFQEDKDGMDSRVEASWGHIHDSTNTPVDELQTASIDRDQILMPLVNQPLPLRDGIRIDNFGVTVDHSKFDCSYLPIGHRFTFDLTFWDEHHSDEWDILLSLFYSPFFCLGSRTRAGFGAFNVESIRTAEFDLTKIGDLVRYSTISPKISENNPELKEIDTAAKVALTTKHDSAYATIRLTLNPEDGGYRFGSGKFSLGNHAAKTADQLPLSEQKIVWENKCGKISENRFVVIPASSIKGAISHRVAFHYNRLTEHFVTTDLDRGTLKDPQENPGVIALFGYAKGNDEGKAGLLWWKEEYLNPSIIKTHYHNHIDSFTGGVRKGMLFTEEIVHDVGYKLTIKVKQSANIDQNTLKALKMSFEDLAKGRLALGASGRGHGYFTGELTWPDIL